MFKKLSITFLFLAIISLLAHAFFPHHEHGNKVCFEIAHEHDSDHQPHDAFQCAIGKQEVIRNQDEISESLGCGHGSGCDYHFPPILLFLGDFFAFSSEPEEIILTPYYLNLYTSADLSSANFLRGPPQI